LETLPRAAPLAAPLDLDILLARRGRRRPDARLVEALAEHIRSTGLYPPLIVRPHPRLHRRWEIIDGLARAEALRRLGESQARCEIWLVDNRACDLLAATLNCLRGRGDPRQSARLTRRLVGRLGAQQTCRLLGLTPAGLKQRLATLAGAPAPACPEKVLPLRPVTFHLTEAESRRLEAALAGYMHGCPVPKRPWGLASAGGDRRCRRGQALLALVEGQPRNGPVRAGR
jgi:hypothetical protein